MRVKRISPENVVIVTTDCRPAAAESCSKQVCSSKPWCHAHACHVSPRPQLDPPAESLIKPGTVQGKSKEIYFVLATAVTLMPILRPAKTYVLGLFDKIFPLTYSCCGCSSRGTARHTNACSHSSG